MKQALGLVEIAGLSTAIVVADAMAKAANVEIIEVENTKGLGYMTIKVTGDVGAVNASVQAGCQLGRMHDKLVSCKVIPRPSDFVEQTFCTPAKAEPQTAPQAEEQKEEPEEKTEPLLPEAPEAPEPSSEPEPERPNEERAETVQIALEETVPAPETAESGEQPTEAAAPVEPAEPDAPKPRRKSTKRKK